MGKFLRALWTLKRVHPDWSEYFRALWRAQRNSRVIGLHHPNWPGSSSLIFGGTQNGNPWAGREALFTRANKTMAFWGGCEVNFSKHWP